MRFVHGQGRAASLVIVVAALLAACGGGDSGGATSATASAQQIEGSVITIEGARVFLDRNGNHELDAGEPAAVTTGDGRFLLPVGNLTTGELAMTTLVAEIPLHAKDAADGGLTLQQAGRRSLTLTAPASAYLRPGSQGLVVQGPVVISPMTALVASEVSFNGMTSPDGVQVVQQALGLGGLDPMSDFSGQTGQRLWQLSRIAGIALGEYAAAAARTGDEHGDPSVRDQLRFAMQLLKDNLPALEQQFRNAVAVPSVQSAARVQIPARAVRLPDGFVRFIVRFDPAIADPRGAAQEMAAAHGGRVRFTYEELLRGFAIEVPEANVGTFVDALDSDPRVDRVEPDQPVVAVQQTQSTTAVGLDRIDQRALPLAQRYSFNTTGAGVRAYILDSGIRGTHREFAGRLQAGFSTIADGRGTDDCNGHGTHVAGTVGGTTWGVAKNVTLVPVRVLGCDGSGLMSDIVAGLDWVIANAPRPAVVNMSLGGGASATLDAAVERAVTRGIPVVAAAGNSNVSACNSSPARAAPAITVGATDANDARASFSNFGTCLDLFAPGVNIPSAGIASDTAAVAMSGTSMAAPHVAGYVARLLEASPSASATAVASVVRNNATTGVLQNIGAGSPDALLFANPVTDLATAPPPPPQPVVVRQLSVGALAGASWNLLRGNWRAYATIAVQDASGAMVPGVVVRGSFSVGGTNLFCTTTANGTCTVYTGSLGRTTAETRFTVTNLSSSSGAYAPAANRVTTVVIRRP